MVNYTFLAVRDSKGTFTYPEPVEYSPRFSTLSVGKSW